MHAGGQFLGPHASPNNQSCNELGTKPSGPKGAMGPHGGRVCDTALGPPWALGERPSVCFTRPCTSKNSQLLRSPGAQLGFTEAGAAAQLMLPSAMPSRVCTSSSSSTSTTGGTGIALAGTPGADADGFGGRRCLRLALE